MEKILRFIDNMSYRIFKTASLIILIVMMVIVYEVVARYAFNAPTIWCHELASLLCGVLWIWGGAYCILIGSHVKMDIIYDHVSTRWKTLMDLITLPFFLIFIITLLYYGGKGAWVSLMITEHTPSVWHPPIYIQKIIIVLGIFLVLLQGLSKFFLDLRKVVMRKAAIK